MLSREDQRPRVKDQRDNESRKPETKPRITLSASTSQQDTGRIEAEKIAVFAPMERARVTTAVG